jgi:hypothetical protein
MDYELIFWIAAPAAVLLLALWRGLRALRAEDNARELEKLTADDFNKDFWEE